MILISPWYVDIPSYFLNNTLGNTGGDSEMYFVVHPIKTNKQKNLPASVWMSSFRFGFMDRFVSPVI